MAELRRLLVEPSRLQRLNGASGLVPLNDQEQHYLRRVLRLRSGDPIAVIDGAGHLWMAQLRGQSELEFSSSPAQPCETQPVPSPVLGVAFALVRRGMDDGIRMACELGIDRFQPLHMARCTPQAEHRPDRWRSMLREATEQCERLWQPDLLPLQHLHTWDPGSGSQVAFAVTRRQGIPSDGHWLRSESNPQRPTWLVIGPEGGWTDAETDLAFQRGWQAVSLGDPILRSSTACVRAAVGMTQWREQIRLSS